MLALSPLTPLLAIMPAKMGTVVLALGSYDHDQPCQQFCNYVTSIYIYEHIHGTEQKKQPARRQPGRSHAADANQPDALPYSNSIAAELRHICLLQNTIK